MSSAAKTATHMCRRGLRLRRNWGKSHHPEVHIVARYGGPELSPATERQSQIANDLPIARSLTEIARPRGETEVSPTEICRECPAITINSGISERNGYTCDKEYRAGNIGVAVSNERQRADERGVNLPVVELLNPNCSGVRAGDGEAICDWVIRHGRKPELETDFAVNGRPAVACDARRVEERFLRRHGWGGPLLCTWSCQQCGDCVKPSFLILRTGVLVAEAGCILESGGARVGRARLARRHWQDGRYQHHGDNDVFHGRKGIQGAINDSRLHPRCCEATAPTPRSASPSRRA